MAKEGRETIHPSISKIHAELSFVGKEIRKKMPPGASPSR
jgi:hypothetical protein